MDGILEYSPKLQPYTTICRLLCCPAAIQTFLLSPNAGVQEKMGIMNRGVVYALWDYESEEDDELQFREGNCMTVVRREDEDETDWWWARMGDQEGYIPRNLLGVSVWFF